MSDFSDRLRRTAAKLRVVGHLFETQDPDHLPPVDGEKINFGLSIFIMELVDELEILARRLETMPKAKSK